MHYNGYLCELFLELYTKCTINSLHPTMYTCPCTLMNSIQNVMSLTNMGGSIMSFFLHQFTFYVIIPFQLGWLPAPLLKCRTRSCLNTLPFPVISKDSHSNFMLCTTLTLFAASVYNILALAPFDPCHAWVAANMPCMPCTCCKHWILVSSRLNWIPWALFPPGNSLIFVCGHPIIPGSWLLRLILWTSSLPDSI